MSATLVTVKESMNQQAGEESIALWQERGFIFNNLMHLILKVELPAIPNPATPNHLSALIASDWRIIKEVIVVEDHQEVIIKDKWNTK